MKTKIFTSLTILTLAFWGCTTPEKISQVVHFKKVIVHDTFISEGVAVADVNQDGAKDIIAGPLWFEAPEWISHEIFASQPYDPAKEYSKSFLNFPMDVNQDGWMDFILFDFPGTGVYWYENPKGTEQHWNKYLIDTTACNESPMLVDLDNDGQRDDLIFGKRAHKEMMWFEARVENDTVIWEGKALSVPGSPGTDNFSHGLGLGDVNKDGRNDVIIREGWWEAPENRRQLPWNFHPAPLGKPCAQMHVYDFDQDGDHDVIASSAHDFGIWWYEQEDSTFITHLIDSTFSETHAAALVDMNEDGTPDLITGKRYFAHMGEGPGGMDPAVIYWMELHSESNKMPQWTKHLIDDNSGVGIQMVVEDLNGDGKPDIINANKKGVICFIQE